MSKVFVRFCNPLPTSLLSGAREHVVMRRLGHADIQTTLNLYGWVSEDAELRALADWRSFCAGWRGWDGGAGE
jgi:integrase/recombinase XerD